MEKNSKVAWRLAMKKKLSLLKSWHPYFKTQITPLA